MAKRNTPATIEDVGTCPETFESFEDWLAFGQSLNSVSEGIQWMIGDWIAVGVEEFPEQAHESVADVLRGFDPAALSVNRRVAERFDRSERWPQLTWSHHHRVVHFPVKERNRLLELAATRKWSVRQLMEEAQRSIRRADDAQSKLRGEETKTEREARRLERIRAFHLFCDDIDDDPAADLMVSVPAALLKSIQSEVKRPAEPIEATSR